jgi:hypothetical protein
LSVQIQKLQSAVGVLEFVLDEKAQEKFWKISGEGQLERLKVRLALRAFWAGPGSGFKFGSKIVGSFLK